MAESNVPITRISNIKMLVAFARNGNKFKKTNNKKQQRNKKQKTKNQRNCREEEGDTERERGVGEGGVRGEKRNHCKSQQALKVKANYFLN